MPAIHQIVPDPQALLALEVPEAALVLLQHIASIPQASASQPLSIQQSFTVAVNPANGYIDKDQSASRHKGAITELLIAAWVWLEREGLLLPAPGYSREFVFVGARGREAIDKEKFDRYRHAALLPRAILHPSIEAGAFSAFLRGDYDIAIFVSFRAVEDAVRIVTQLPPHMVGVDLMRDAFKANIGPLANKTLIKAEQDAMAHLFAGSMGSFKNPTSHRLNAFDRPSEALSLVLFANYLLNLVYERAKANGLIP
jgi:uncharacterized protein (TIGR02391 family)